MTEYFDRYKARCSEAESDRDLLATGYGDRIEKVISSRYRPSTTQSVPRAHRDEITRHRTYWNSCAVMLGQAHSNANDRNPNCAASTIPDIESRKIRRPV